MNIKFDRQEWAGAFGDIGTDLPLIIGMILASGLDAASVLIIYGAMQVLSGFLYQRPMPVQPLKAVAALVITQKIAGPVILGGGFAIAMMMLLLTLTGALEFLGRIIPKCVVRGIQFGLGLSLGILALKDYLARDGVIGYCLGFVAFILVLFLLGNKKIPAALAVIGLGLVYALLFKIKLIDFSSAFGFHLPQLAVPKSSDIWTGFLILALPQIPLSLGNSIYATRQVNDDLFPERPLSIKKIGLTYGGMNIISSLLSGVPVCHGSGGMMGHYTFGARTGGSLLIYGGMFLCLGLFFSEGVTTIIKIFPMPILGIILFIESLAIMNLIRDLSQKDELWIAFMVGLISVSLPNGFVLGLLAGAAVYHLRKQLMI